MCGATQALLHWRLLAPVQAVHAPPAQIWASVHLAQVAPQLFRSVGLGVQVSWQEKTPPAPALQLLPAPHAVHPSQWALVWGATHALPHWRLLAPVQVTHAPPVQTWPSAQAAQLGPQLARSV